mmetsp:Transcript_3818/g.6873  ORF Transcript_3818/g.6873 Transcript_3818/m.6873 type:complete len:428 (-) Transcript_3818:43-1326(-)
MTMQPRLRGLGAALVVLAAGLSCSFLLPLGSNAAPPRAVGHQARGSEDGVSGRPAAPLAGLVVASLGFVSVALSRRSSVAAKCASADDSDLSTRRRDVSLAMLTLAAPAHAEEVASSSPTIQTSPMKLQRVVVDVGNAEAMEKELKFWVGAAGMKVLSDSTGDDGQRSVTVGYIPEKEEGSFAIEIKVDASVLTRKRPSQLNYSVMQPTVNALNFTQVSQPDTVFDMYARVEASPGTSLVGDARYLDCESPRGVQVRMVPRKGEPSIELVSLNIEVPAFKPTVKFYERVGGLKETTYNEAEEAPIQKFSVLLESEAPGPKLLLCPVPDFRVKQRDRDEFVGLVMASQNPQQVASAAEKAIEVAMKEEAEKDEEERQKLLLAGKPIPEKKKLQTLARPTVEMDGKMARLNDGVGTMVRVAEAREFRAA